MEYWGDGYWDEYEDVFYYITNVQGDVVAIVDSDGYVMVQYDYDAWGKPIRTQYADETVSTYITYFNPLRYRGYVYDQETGLYYLQSRYYDPEIGRFINADAFTSTGQGVLGNNMFAYCGNNPVNRSDVEGNFWDTIFDVVSLVVSVVEVINNPDDPMAWIGLVGDAVDLIPFVTGVGEVTRGIRIANGACEAIDTAGDIAKAGKKAPIIIGENMKRVRQYAKEIGGHAYQPWKNVPFDYNLAMKRNKRWINDMMAEGREIIDIGPDFARRRTGVAPSDFYNMERSQVKGYANYTKVFTEELGENGKWIKRYYTN